MVEEKRVPEGYKMTEVGVIPEDWEVISFGEAFKFLSTGNNSRSDLKEQGDVRYIHYGDIHTKWRNILDCSIDNLPYIDEKKVKHLPRIEEGDLVIADASEDYEGLGISVEIKNVNHNKIVAGLHTLLLRGNKIIFANGFKGYIQELNLVKNQLKKIATGISVYGISKNNLKNVMIPLPPLTEQQAIAEVLTDVDNLISSLEKLIDKKEKIKQGAMQELLTGKRRLPGFDEDWEVKRLGEILNYEQPSKYIINTKILEKGTIPVLTANKSFLLGYTEEQDGIFNNVPVIIFDDFTTLSKKVIHPFKVKSSALKILKPKDKSINLDFIYGVIQMIKYPIGDHKRYYLSEYQYIEIKLPKIEEQQAIAQILSDMDAEIESLNQKLQKYKAIKQGMMQELLTGRVRLV